VFWLNNILSGKELESFQICFSYTKWYKEDDKIVKKALLKLRKKAEELIEWV
jgi:hypothetical protein